MSIYLKKQQKTTTMHYEEDRGNKSVERDFFLTTCIQHTVYTGVRKVFFWIDFPVSSLVSSQCQNLCQC